MADHLEADETTPIEVTFITKNGEFSTRLSRAGAIRWLKEHGTEALIRESPTGKTETAVDDLTDQDLARAMAAATWKWARVQDDVLLEEDENEASYAAIRLGEELLGVRAIPDFQIEPGSTISEEFWGTPSDIVH